MKKSNLKLMIEVKVVGGKKGKDWSKVEDRLEAECAAYLRIFLNPEINDALFGIRKGKREN